MADYDLNDPYISLYNNAAYGGYSFEEDPYYQPQMPQASSPAWSEIAPKFPPTLTSPPSYTPPPTYNPPSYTPPSWPSWPSTPAAPPKTSPPASTPQQQPKQPDLTPLSQTMSLMVAPQQSQNVIVGGQRAQPLPFQADRSFRGKDPGIARNQNRNYLDMLRAGFSGGR